MVKQSLTSQMIDGVVESKKVELSFNPAPVKICYDCYSVVFSGVKNCHHCYFEFYDKRKPKAITETAKRLLKEALDGEKLEFKEMGVGYIVGIKED